jgi:hypothetical protein
MLPENLRVRIWKAYVPGQEITKTVSPEYVQALLDAQEWIKNNPRKDALKESILLWLKCDGPLSDLGLYSRLTDFETGGFGSTVLTTCLELQEEGFIEPPPNDPHVWQLSDKGLEHVAAKKQSQEVPLGS